MSARTMVAPLLVCLLSNCAFAADDPEPALKGKPLREWVAKLQSANLDDSVDARLAVETLLMGPERERTLQCLGKLVDSEDKTLCENAIYQLNQLGIEGRAAWPKLRALLSDKAANIRFQAAMNLHTIAKRLAAPYRACDGALAETLPEPDELGFKDVRAALTAIVKDKEAGEVRPRAAGVLGALGTEEAKVAVAYLRRAVRDENRTIRTASIYALLKLGRLARDAAPDLVDALRSNTDRTQSSIIHALVAVDPEDKKEAIEALQKLLKDNNPRSGVPRSAALKAMLELGADPKSAIPALEEMLTHTSASLRCDAAIMLWNLNRHPKALAALREALKDRFPSAAIQALQELGPDAKDVVADLVTLMEKGDYLQKRMAASALWRLDRHPGVVPMLLKTLDEKPPAGPDTAYNFSLLVMIAADKNPPKELKDAVPDLVKYLKNEDPRLRMYAFELVKALDRDALLKAMYEK